MPESSITETSQKEGIPAELDALRRTIAALTTERDSIRAELGETRHEARDRRHEAKSLTEQLASLTKERDTLRASAEADPEGLKKALGSHQQTIRELRHEKAFARVARTLKVTDDTKQADLFALAKYRPEADEPDEAKITATFQEALKGRPWLMDADTTAAAGAATTGAGASGASTAQSGGKPGPGADRGQSVDGAKAPPPGFIPGRI